MNKKEKLHSIVKIVWCIFLMVLWIWLDGADQHTKWEADLSLSEQKQLIQQATQQNMWVRSDIPGSRSDYFGWYDATDEFIYFAYTDDNCVDVYDLTGTFQYTLYLPDSPNGAPMVYCQDGKTYIDCKGSTAFIFEGSNCIQKLTDGKEMEQNGDYAITKYRDLSLSGITITKDYVRRYATDGTLMFEFPTPDAVRATINTSFWTRVPPIWYLIVFMLLVTIVIIFIVYRVKSNDENRSKRYGTHLKNLGQGTEEYPG